MLYCGGGPSTGSGATMRGTRKGLEGLGGLRNGAGNTVSFDKLRNQRTVFYRGMEQSTGAIAYPRKARPAASQ